MPYARFHASAESTGYDVELLGRRFGASFEQVAHRLTTLQRPGSRGVPFFFIRVDRAGHVSKRFAAGRFSFATYGGTCPLWALHGAFDKPGHLLTQVIEMEDDSRYFSVARTVHPHAAPFGAPRPQFAVALSCEISHAHGLVYAQGINLDAPRVTPIGINCTMCERIECRQRSAPAASRRFVVDECSRGHSPFRFADL